MTATTTTAYDRLCEVLEKVRHSGKDKAMACCPAHDDRTPSLSITRGKGKVLFHCHAGCDPDAVLDKIGWTRADLYDDRSGYTYPYDDATTRRYYQWDQKRGEWKKKFNQEDHDSSKPTKLYHLHGVEVAKMAGQAVWLVEGEDDVHALETLGAIATTARGGVGMLGKADLSPLYGCNVLAVVDKDGPGGAGEKWAQYMRLMLEGKAKAIVFLQAKIGKDAQDHIAADLGLDDFELYQFPPEESQESEEPKVGNPEPKRQLVLTAAASIKPKRVKWAWKDRWPLGTLALLAGGEGLGKSTVAYDRCARITRGELEGEYFGQPKSVLVCATEDSWEHTIVPRLMAHNADLTKVFRVEVLYEDVHTGLVLPKDLRAVEDAAAQVDAAILLLDPLMSRIDSKIDTHKDQETRQALEPIAALADKSGMCVLGIIHHNKSGSTDPLQLVMASKAFTAVARSVHTVIRDPDDENKRLFGMPKNNLGRTDLDTLVFTIASHSIDTDEGTAWTGRIEWAGVSATSISEAMRHNASRDEDGGATSDAAEWLKVYLTAEGGSKESAKVKAAGTAASHNETAIQRARKRLGVTHRNQGFPSKTWWFLPGSDDDFSHASSSHVNPGESDITDTTDTTGDSHASHASYASHFSTRESDTTDDGVVGDLCRQCFEFLTDPPGSIDCVDLHKSTKCRECSAVLMHPDSQRLGLCIRCKNARESKQS